MSSKSSRIKGFIADTFAAAGGSISFERFMELALYHPEFGYYTAGIEDVGGSRADFSTSATLFDLGESVANWIKTEIEFHRFSGTKISLIEIGAGDGSLAAGVLKRFSFLQRRKLDYRIVEISPILRAEQARTLKGRKVHWHHNMKEAILASGGGAIIFSNELVDAFPAKWLRWNGTRWEEIYVKYSPEAGLSEEFRPADVTVEWPEPPLGQRVELHDSYFEWLNNWLSLLERGSLLTIDYGDISLPEIYSGKKHGSLRGYFRQQRIEGGGVYQRFGKQDLTADVDFSRLVSHGESRNLVTVELEDQRKFMGRFASLGDMHPEAAKAFYTLHQRRI